MACGIKACFICRGIPENQEKGHSSIVFNSISYEYEEKYCCEICYVIYFKQLYEIKKAFDDSKKLNDFWLEAYNQSMKDRDELLAFLDQKQNYFLKQRKSWRSWVSPFYAIRVDAYLDMIHHLKCRIFNTHKMPSALKQKAEWLI